MMKRRGISVERRPRNWPSPRIRWWDEFFGGAPKNTRGARVLPGEKRSQRLADSHVWVAQGFNARILREICSPEEEREGGEQFRVAKNQSGDLFHRAAFTLVELLVVIAVIGILAALLLPVLSKAKQKAKGVECLSNMKQLTTAWMLYAGEYNDLLVTNIPGPNTTNWAAGWLDLTDPTDTDNTNIATLMSPEGLLWPYSKSLPIYRCPADPYTIAINGANYPLVRSVSMNQRLNGGEYNSAPLFEFNNPNKLAAIINPGPSTAFVFIDERADSINDGFFVIDMEDTGPQAVIGNTPADYHLGCSSVSFADGHVEIHKWLDPRTEMRPYEARAPVPNDPDIAWMQEHCCSRK